MGLSLRGKKILILDRESDSYAIAAALSNRSGSIVTEAQTVNQAEELLTTERFDAIVMELLVHWRENEVHGTPAGLTFLEAIRKGQYESQGVGCSRDIPVLVCSITIVRENKSRVLELLGVNGFWLDKPASLDETETALAMLLRDG